MQMSEGYGAVILQLRDAGERMAGGGALLESTPGPVTTAKGDGVIENNQRRRKKRSSKIAGRVVGVNKGKVGVSKSLLKKPRHPWGKREREGMGLRGRICSRRSVLRQSGRPIYREISGRRGGEEKKKKRAISLHDAESRGSRLTTYGLEPGKGPYKGARAGRTGKKQGVKAKSCSAATRWRFRTQKLYSFIESRKGERNPSKESQKCSWLPSLSVGKEIRQSELKGSPERFQGDLGKRRKEISK